LNEIRKKSKIAIKTHESKLPGHTFAQAANIVVNVFYIKEAFPVLPNKKILEIYQATFATPKIKKVQITTKGPLRKQAIVPLSKEQSITNGHLLICD